MKNQDDKDELDHWVEVMNMTAGYGSVFNYKTAEDKAIVELSTANEWCNSIKAEFNLMVGEPEHNPADPPDCYVTINRKRLAVELVQLIEPDHKKRAAHGETPYAGKLFLDMQWSKERLGARLNEVLQNKSKKYIANEVNIDVLVIHTDETWLDSSQAEEWLTDIVIAPQPNIGSTFLLFSHHPGCHDWPVHLLHGDLAGEI